MNGWKNRQTNKLMNKERNELMSITWGNTRNEYNILDIFLLIHDSVLISKEQSKLEHFNLPENGVIRKCSAKSSALSKVSVKTVFSRSFSQN